MLQNVKTRGLATVQSLADFRIDFRPWPPHVRFQKTAEGREVLVERLPVGVSGLRGIAIGFVVDATGIESQSSVAVRTPGTAARPLDDDLRHVWAHRIPHREVVL